jgi:diacylglycerol kinase (ATP)
MEGEAETVVGSSSKPCGQLEDYYIPDYILKPGVEQVLVDHAPPCPIVVFINSRSGGQLGSSLIKTYRELLNEAQVPLVFLGMRDHGNVLLALMAF